MELFISIKDNGIINTAIKGNLASEDLSRTVTGIMATLNRTAAEVMNEHPVHACTDITGFGLIGHLAEMIQGTGLGIRVALENLPVIEEALEFASMGLVPAGAHKNREFREPVVNIDSGVDPALRDILYDPQTSGGLCIAVASSSAEKMVDQLHDEGINYAAVIGEVVDEPAERLQVI